MVLWINLDQSIIKMLLGPVVGFTAIIILTGRKRTAKNERVASVPVDIACGLLTGSTGIADAPIILFFANQQMEPRQFPANITIYLVVVNAAALPSFPIGGLVTAAAAWLAAMLIPPN